MKWKMVSEASPAMALISVASSDIPSLLDFEIGKMWNRNCNQLSQEGVGPERSMLWTE